MTAGHRSPQSAPDTAPADAAAHARAAHARAAHARAALATHLSGGAMRTAPAGLAAVTHRGRVVAVSAYGEPRRDGAATRSDTVFRIASMSKSFLAATALALRDEGVLDLHAPVAALVPRPAMRGAGEEAVASVTLDALLSNRGGLPEDNPWGDDHLGDSREHLASLIGGNLRLSTLPGTEYQYSNIGQSLVGRAIEAVTGRPVEDVVRERMLAPLGLSATRWSAAEYPPGSDLAAGFRTFDEGATFAPEPYVGSGALACIGALFSTAEDIATWMHFLGSAFDGHPAAPDVLSPASRREMQTARTMIPTAGGVFTGRDGDLDGAGYGYGLVVEHDRRFGRVVQHAGGLPGFSSHMRWHPPTGIGVVAFGNADGFGAGRIAAAVLRDVLVRIDAPSAVVRPWPETVRAAARVDELLRAGRPLSDAGDLLARNVLTDVPADVRAQRLELALAEVGAIRPDTEPLPARVATASDAAALRWTIPCERGALVCDVRLVGLATPVVQAVAVAVAGPDGRKPRDEPPSAADHHAVALG